MNIRTKLAQSVAVAIDAKLAMSKDEFFTALSDKLDTAGSALSRGANAVSDAGKAVVNKITDYTGDPEVSRETAYARAMAEDSVNTAASMPSLAKSVMVLGNKDKPSIRDVVRTLSDAYASTEYPAKAMLHAYDPHPLTGIKTPTLSRVTSGGRYDRHPIDKALSGNYYDATDDALYNAKDYLKGYLGRNIMGVGAINAGLDKGNSAGLAGGAGLLAANNAIPIAALLAGLYGYKGLRRLLRR